jgi:hypothetical protein
MNVCGRLRELRDCMFHVQVHCMMCMLPINVEERW